MHSGTREQSGGLNIHITNNSLSCKFGRLLLGQRQNRREEEEEEGGVSWAEDSEVSG